MKKILAIVLTLTLALSLTSVVALAAPAQDMDSDGTIVFDYEGNGFVDPTCPCCTCDDCVCVDKCFEDKDLCDCCDDCINGTGSNPFADIENGGSFYFGEYDLDFSAINEDSRNKPNSDEGELVGMFVRSNAKWEVTATITDFYGDDAGVPVKTLEGFELALTENTVASNVTTLPTIEAGIVLEADVETKIASANSTGIFGWDLSANLDVPGGYFATDGEQKAVITWDFATVA